MRACERVRARQVDLVRVIGPLVPPATKSEESLAETFPNLAISHAVEARHGFTGIFHLREDVAKQPSTQDVEDSGHMAMTLQVRLHVRTQRVVF